MTTLAKPKTASQVRKNTQNLWPRWNTMAHDPLFWVTIAFCMVFTAVAVTALVISAQPGEMVPYTVENFPPAPAYAHQYVDGNTGELVYMIDPSKVEALVQNEFTKLPAPQAMPEYVACKAFWYPGALVMGLDCPHGYYDMVGFEVWAVNNGHNGVVYLGLEDNPFLTPGCWQVGENIEGHKVYACPAS